MKLIKHALLSGIPLFILGAALVLGGVGLTGQNLHEDRVAGIHARRAVEALVLNLPEETLRPAPVPITEEEVLVTENRVLPVATVDGRDYVGLLQIPALSLELPVQTPYEYDSLAYSPCLYVGNPYHKNMVICGHNYRSHFGELKKLQEGDELLFIAMDGEVFRYRLLTLEVLDANAVREMIDPTGWDLTIFTCTVGGEYRVTARFASN